MTKIQSMLIAVGLALAASTTAAAPAVPVKAPGGALSALPAMPAVSAAATQYTPPASNLLSPLSAGQVQLARQRQNAAPAFAMGEDVPQLRGWVVWPASMLGLFNIPKTDTDSFQPVGNGAFGVVNGGGYDDGHGTYHGVYYEQGSGSVVDIKIIEISTVTFEVTGVRQLDPSENIGAIATDVDVDPTSGTVYGCYMNDNASGYVWGRCDYTTGQRTAIAQLDASSRLVAVGCDATGQFYGITRNADLVKIDKLTGQVTTVGSTTIPSEGYLAGYMAGGAVERASNCMYVTYITSDNLSGIYTVNLENAESSPAVTFATPAMVVSPFFESEVTEAVPAAPVLTVTAPEGTMTLTYTIEMPATLADGYPAQGELGWELFIGGEPAYSGTAPAGQTVEGTHTVSQAGMVYASAVVSNSAGKSLPAEVSLYVGMGVPSAPSQVTAQWADGTATVVWEAVTESADGGYLNAEGLTYNVYLGDELIASGLTANSYSHSVAMPQDRCSYQYKVTAVNSGLESSPTLSNILWLGAYQTPYASDFTSLSYSDKLESIGYTVVDANGDGRTWDPMGMGRGVRYYYHNSNSADDWLITPEIAMEAGKVYAVSIFVSNYGSSDIERMEVKAGMGTTPEAMTMEVIAPMDVNNTAGFYVNGIVAPTQTGSWNVGIHCISDPYKYYLIVRDLSIGKGMAAATPAAVENIVLTPEPSGLLELTGKFTLPQLDVVGQPISGNVTVRVSRGGETVATLSGAPGAELTFTDNAIAAKGDYTYTVTTLLGEEEGVSASATVFVGPYAAAAPTAISAAETSQPGVVSLEWDAVTADVNGSTLNAENVSYMVYSVETIGTFNTVVTPLLDAPTSQTSATVVAMADPSVQKFMQFAVKALNRGEESEDCVGDLIAVGNAYSLPVTYSGTASQSTYIERISSAGTGFWGIYNHENLTNSPRPQATDDYYGCYAGAAELYGDLYTGKIDLTSAAHPEVSFYTYRYPENHDYFVGADINFIQVIALVDGEMTLIGTADHSTMAENRWTKVRMDLSAFNGKNVQLIFRAVAKSGNYTLLDEITVKETPEKDMEALYFDAPATCAAGVPFNVVATLANHGYADAAAFTVNFYRDGVLAEERTIDALAAGAELTVAFEQQISYFDVNDTEASFSAEIVMAGDQDNSNDTFAAITVVRPVSTLPAVTDLAGVNVPEGNRLTWTKYTTDVLEPVEITEGFESATAWETEYEGWTFFSENPSPVDYIYGYQFPGVTAYETQLAYLVVNNLGVESELPSAGGQQYIASLCKSDRQANNDWAVSPLLSGDAQTISFYAKGVRAYYPELFEVYCTSDDSTDPQAYVKISGDDAITAPSTEWGRYEYQLPEGTKHFAVRCVSAYCYFLMLDEFTFTPDPLAGAPVLAGYDVYRDCEKLNTEPVAHAEYIDANPTDTHTYHVVAKYDKGDSELSNAATIQNSGAEGSIASQCRVYTDGGSIVVSGAMNQSVRIVAVDGRTVYAGTGDCRVTAAPAVYIVSVGTTATKVVVR